MNNIYVENGYQRDAQTYYPVLIIGASESGIAMGWRLKEKLGFSQFIIFDRQSGVGGECSSANTDPGMIVDS